MDLPAAARSKNRDRKGLEAGEGSSRQPAPLPSFKGWGGVPVPLPEPRTPRTSRSSEKKRLNKLHRLRLQAADLNEEIQIAQRAPMVSVTCAEVVASVQTRGREDPFVSNLNAAPPMGNRWFRPPTRRQRFTCWSCF